MSDRLRVSIEDGKYTIVQPEDGVSYALRYGERWRELLGDSLMLSAAYEIEELRERVAALEVHKVALREAAVIGAAHLAGAISLLEKGGKAAKKAAPSDRMFDMMLEDGCKALKQIRAILKETLDV